MRITRRAFMKYCAVAAGALGLTTTDLMKIEESFAKINNGGPHVVWLPGQACTGCTMSLTNSIYYTTVDSLLLNTIDLDYSETLAAAAGEKIVESAISAIGKPMVLALEGSIPSSATGGDDHFCTVWSRGSGVVAGGSTVNGTVVTDGHLTYKLPVSTTLTTGDVIKAGSEIAATTTLPGGTTIANEDDRSYLAGTYASSGGYGSDVMNAPVTLTSDITTQGVITMYGGGAYGGGVPGSPYPSGSIIGDNTLITDGTVVYDSYDRYHITNNHAASTTTQSLSWSISLTGGLVVTTTDTNGVTLTDDRTLSGMVELAAGSILSGSPVRTRLQALTKVPNTNDQVAIDSDLSVFGFTTSTSDVLATVYSYTGSDFVLRGDVTLPTSGVVTGSLGSDSNEVDKTMLNEATLFGVSAAAILCVGTCSSFGGIPAAQGNLTGAAGVLYKGRTKPNNYNGAMTATEFASKTINVAGCPPHSDWIVGTVAYLLATNFALPPLEAYARPLDYYGEYQCNAGPCEWRYNQGYTSADEALYTTPKDIPQPANAEVRSDLLYKHKWDVNGTTRYVGCIGVLGCKGRKTKADCSMRRWNADAAAPSLGAGWCVASGAGCHGCTEPAFPDKVGKFFNFA